MTDANQNVVWQADYTAFGEAKVKVAVVESNLRFPGQYFDVESGLHQNYFRDYDPGAGRYLQSDPIGLGGGINTYAYVGGNPIGYTDSFGLSYESGGPWHPPKHVKFKCKKSDSISQLRGKIWIYTKMLASHQGWDWKMGKPRGGGRHKNEISDLWSGFAKCSTMLANKIKKSCKKSVVRVRAPLLWIWDTMQTMCKMGIRGACGPVQPEPNSI